MEKVLGWTVDLVERPRKPAPDRGSPEGVGSRMGQGGPRGRQGGRLAQAHAAPRFPGLTSSLGCGANVFLDRSEQEDELRDYERLTETSEAFI